MSKSLTSKQLETIKSLQDRQDKYSRSNDNRITVFMKRSVKGDWSYLDSVLDGVCDDAAGDIMVSANKLHKELLRRGY